MPGLNFTAHPATTGLGPHKKQASTAQWLWMLSTLLFTTQGTALGLSNSFVSLGRIVGALCAGMLFDLGMDIPYWCGA